MRIDIVLGITLGRGGLETVVTSVSNGLVHRGHNVRVFQACQSSNAEWESKLPEIYYYDPKILGFAERFEGEPDFVRYALGYRALLDNMGAPDVILATHTPALPLITRMAIGNHNSAPIISWLHGPPESYGDPSGLSFADAHLAISTGIASDIARITPGQAIFSAPNPLDLDVPPVRRSPMFEILYIGRLDNEQKNLGFLIDNLHKVRSSSWHLTMIGDGPARTSIENEISKNKMSENVAMLGWKDDPWDLVAQASLLVLTSHYEGFGLVLGEALARGIPVLSPRLTGPEDFVIPNQNGWLFAPGDGNKFREILENLIQGNQPLPTLDDCTASVKRFGLEETLTKIESAISYTRAFF